MFPDSVVLEHYPPLFRTGTLTLPADLPHGGGFSGAGIYRLQPPGAAFCLRAWPASDTLAQVGFRQHLMHHARAAGLSFVPALVPPRHAAAAPPWVVHHAGRLWDLSDWMPGRADFWDRPSRLRLQAACRALAQLHVAWQPLAPPDAAVCPAVERRLALLAPARQHLQAGPKWDHLPETLTSALQRGQRLLATWLEQVPRLLAPWHGRWPAQPCLCDVWHDHLLFSGDELTGLVDYGAAKIDHVAVDLARMLGSLIEDDEQAWQEGLHAYRQVRLLHPDEEALARALDRSGTILALAGWLQRLSAAVPAAGAVEGIRRRLDRLVRRIAGWA